MERKSTILANLLLIIIPGLSFAQVQDIPLLAYELRMNGSPYRAIHVLDSGLKHYPDSARFWFEKGRCLDWVKLEECRKFKDSWSILLPNLNDCGRCYHKACHLSPENGRYQYWAASNHSLISLVYFYTPWKWPLVPFEMRKAVHHHKRAVQLNPGNPEYRLALINMLRFGWVFGGNMNMARSHADTLQTINPLYGIMASDLLQNQKQPYNTLQHLQELEQIQPDNLRLLREIASFYERKGSGCSDSCVLYCTRILENNPGDEWAVKMLYRKLPSEKKDDFMPYLLSYLDHVSTGHNYHKSIGLRLLGYYFRDLGDIAKSKGFLAAANYLNPNNNNTYLEDNFQP